MEPKNFYQQLPPFDDFHRLTEEGNYHNIPDDWSVVIVDIKGSTQAIESGRYKDVNTVGAASIVCAQNAMPGIEFPFVFGGDGSTMVIPPSYLKKVTDQLIALKDLSLQQFQLELRVGVVAVSELLKERPHSLRVAKFEVTAGRSVAIFQGGGLTLAEDKVKNQPKAYELISEGNCGADLAGLSCRWQPIPSQKGRIMSLIVQATGPTPSTTYETIITQLSETLEGDIEKANPVGKVGLNYQSFSKCFSDEKRYHKSLWSISFFLRAIEILYAVFVFKIGLPGVFFAKEPYIASLSSHSDYRKFDDVLRMTIDCSPKQEKEICLHLEKLHQKGDIFFGVHTSSESLMTCFVSGLGDGDHLHFVDGGDGGYAVAAKSLKEQIKREQLKATPKAA